VVDPETSWAPTAGELWAAATLDDARGGPGLRRRLTLGDLAFALTPLLLGVLLLILGLGPGDVTLAR
jgi:hypothetical protein